jgi:hypothetical protein
MKMKQKRLKSSNESGAPRVYHNIPQLLFYIIKAHITLCFWGRATGKTEGPGVDFTLHNILTMPQSLGGLVSVSYDKLLTFIQPKLIKGWEKYGYIEDTHFWVRKFAPKDLKRKRPFLSPTEPKHFIHWYNGSGIQLISLDRLGISNAADLDWIYADEARLFDYEKFIEVINANRGNADKFGHLAQHHSVLLTTDKPRDSKGSWLYDLADQNDPELIEMIMLIEEQIYDLNITLSQTKSQKKARRIQSLIDDFQAELQELRIDSVACIEASTLDNIHALGVEPIKNFKRQLTDIAYRISILNETVKEVEQGFYPDLEDTVHGYDAVNHSWLDTHEINHRDPDPDCRWYTDYNPNAPLDIALDTNAKINNIVTGQGNRSEYRIQSSKYYEGPFKKLLEQWDRFYKHHPEKVVNYYHDHTDIKGRADSDMTYADEIPQILRSLGWQVNPAYIGMQPTYRSRYLMWQKMLTSTDDKFPAFKYNRSTSDYWAERARMTGTRIGPTGFEKDKRDEKKPNFDQREAPHITDAADTLIIGAVLLRLTGSSEFTDLTVG